MPASALAQLFAAAKASTVGRFCKRPETRSRKMLLSYQPRRDGEAEPQIRENLTCPPPSTSTKSVSGALSASSRVWDGRSPGGSSGGYFPTSELRRTRVRNLFCNLSTRRHLAVLATCRLCRELGRVRWLSAIKAGGGRPLIYESIAARPVFLGSCQEQEKIDGKRDVSEMAGRAWLPVRH
jgi:hypothetical protein